jgi:hypothetical protein
MDRRIAVRVRFLASCKLIASTISRLKKGSDYSTLLYSSRAVVVTIWVIGGLRAIYELNTSVCRASHIPRAQPTQTDNATKNRDQGNKQVYRAVRLALILFASAAVVGDMSSLFTDGVASALAVLRRPTRPTKNSRNTPKAVIH